MGNRIRGGAGGKPYLGWSRGKAVSGVEPAGNRIRGGAGGKPYPALFQDLPMLWTVGISPLGEGLTGKGNLFPLPCLPHSNHLTSRQHPLPAPSPTGSPYPSAGTPTPPAPSPPRPGAGAVLAISGEQPYPGWSRWKVVPGDRRCAPAFLARPGPRSSPAYPHGVDRGVSRHGGAGHARHLSGRPAALLPLLRPVSVYFR